MKFKTAFHLLVAAMIAFGVTSCGSDKNETDSGSVATTAVTTVATDLISTMQANPGSGVSTKAELLAAISNHQFDQASTAGIYSFVKNSGSSSSSGNCKTVLSIFNFCYSSSSSSSSANSSMISNYYHRKLNTDGTIEKDFYYSYNSTSWDGGQDYFHESPESDDNYGNNIGALRDWLYTLVSNAEQITPDTTSATMNGYYKGFRVYSNGYYYYIDLRIQLIMNPYKIHQ